MMSKTTYIFLLALLISVACSTNKVVEPDTPSLPQDSFEGVLEDSFNGIDVVVYANSKNGLITAFDRRLNSGNLANFSRSDQGFPNVFSTDDNTVWNIFGEAISGPMQGEQLKPVDSQIGYWFSFATFFPTVTLLGENEHERIFDDFVSNEWLIDPSLVITGAIKDGIPALNNPNYIPINSGNCNNDFYVSDNELVTVIKDGDQLKVYPHKILDWHELVNDEINGVPFVLSFCPLTGTSDAWERTINGNVTTFGVSGFLYNNNLILYDRATDSLWPQLLRVSANGEHINKKAKRLQVTEMTWQAAKQISCNILLLSNNTGFSRNYAQYPYGTYKDVEGLLFPITFEDTRVFGKERALSILEGNKVKAYRFSDFEKQ